MMNDLYRKYFQKSFTFLYPLLGFKKRNKHKPIQTYVMWEDVYNKDARKLICVYKRDDSEEWRTFEREHLVTHYMLDYCLPIDKDSVLYVFDFNIFKDDYDHFMNGKYSKMSTRSKQLLTDYYGIHTPEWVFVESYVFPEAYFDKYAEILEIDVKELIKVGELCDKYDPEKETCYLIHPEINLT
jgi:hypothetical protein